MIRNLLLFVTSLMFAGLEIVHAQTLVSPALQSPKPEQPAPPNVLRLFPMDQPDPLLRYRLWPAPEKRLTENPAAIVSRAVILSLQPSLEIRTEFDERFQEWAEMPIEDLPQSEVRRVLSSRLSALNELQRAENLMSLEYNVQLDHLSASEMIRTLLPELQEMRQLGRMLKLRARLAIAEKRWDDVIDDCRLGFRLAEVAGHSTDFLVGRLVGFATSSMMMDVVEEAIQHPGCPNLYWALAGLPEHRLFETRESIEYESVLMSRIFEDSDPLPDYPIGEAAARERIRKLAAQANMTMFYGWGKGQNGSESSQLLSGMYVVMMSEPARDLLAGTPEWGERARELSASEAVLRATQLKLSRTRDRWVAWSLLPPELWDEYKAERDAAFNVNPSSLDLMESLVNMLTPAVNAARLAGRRTHQQRNWLLTVEAIRIHAAREGELPSTIENLRPVPAWQDAISAKTFGYQRFSTNKASLTRAPRWNGDTETTFEIELKGTK